MYEKRLPIHKILLGDKQWYFPDVDWSRIRSSPTPTVIDFLLADDLDSMQDTATSLPTVESNIHFRRYGERAFQAKATDSNRNEGTYMRRQYIIRYKAKIHPLYRRTSRSHTREPASIVLLKTQFYYEEWRSWALWRAVASLRDHQHLTVNNSFTQWKITMKLECSHRTIPPY